MCFSKKEKGDVEETKPARPSNTIAPQRNGSVPVKVSLKASNEISRTNRNANEVGKVNGVIKNGSTSSSNAGNLNSQEKKNEPADAPQPALNTANQDPGIPETGNGPGDTPISVPDTSSTIPPDGLQSSSLWREALNQLDSKKRDALQPPNENKSTSKTSSSSSDIPFIDTVFNAVVKKRKACEEGKWKISFRGKQIILSDVADKVIVWIKHFEKIGDTAAGLDPIHAGLPWAGAKMILQTATAAQDQYAAILISIERIFHLINRCKVYELLYPDVNNIASVSEQSITNLRAALLKLYEHILDSLATTIILLGDHGYQRVFYSLANPGEVDNFLTLIKTQEVTVETEAENCERVISRSQDEKTAANFGALKAKLKEISQPIVRIDDRVAALMRNVEVTERAEALYFISDIASSDDHTARVQRRTFGTGLWLLQHDKYAEWRNTSASTIMWLHGIPGAGKSILVSNVIDDLDSSLKSANSNEALAYFYCNRNVSDHREPALILRSLVKQLCVNHAHKNSIHPAVWNSFIKRKNDGFLSKTLSVDECFHLLLELVNFFPQTNIVLDGLDECDYGARNQLMDTLYKLVDQATRPLKVFISSRESENIRNRLDSQLNIKIERQNERDIAIHVESKLEKYDYERLNYGHKKPLSEELKVKIMEVMQTKSEGMFQWVALHIDEVLKQEREKSISEMLGKLPRGLEAAYDRIFDEINTQESIDKQNIARRAFEWVSCSQMPLMEETLSAAVCQDPNEDTEWEIDVGTETIEDACRNLLVVHPGWRRWQFSHLSVQEYLEEKERKENRDSIETHKMILAVCLRRLCDPKVLKNLDSFRTHWWQYMDWNKMNPSIAKENDEKHPPDIMDVWNVSTEPRVASQLDIVRSINTPTFALLCLLDYATMWWPAHYQRVGDQHMDTNLTTLLRSFLNSLLVPGLGWTRWQYYTQVALDNVRERYVEVETHMTRECYVYVKHARKRTEPIYLMSLVGIYHPVKDLWDELDSSELLKTLEKNDDAAPDVLALALTGENLTIVNRLLELFDKAGVQPLDFPLRPPGRLTKEEAIVVSGDLANCFDRKPRRCVNCNYYITGAGKRCLQCKDWDLCDACGKAGNWEHIEGHETVDNVLPNFYEHTFLHYLNPFRKWRKYEA